MDPMPFHQFNKLLDEQNAPAPVVRQEQAGLAEHPDLLSPRETAGALLYAVIEENITPQVAMNRWPVAAGQHCNDPSLHCALNALWHFEADEDQQRQELFYMDTQLELLNQMAWFLSRNQSLPPYLLQAYAQESSVLFFDTKLSLWRLPFRHAPHAMRQLHAFLRTCYDLLKQAKSPPIFRNWK